MHHSLSISAILLPVLFATAPTAAAQTETTLYQINQSGIGSNGFGTSWRGQDIELTTDAWVTRIVFQTGSATPNVDEIRLMTATPNLVTLRSSTMLSTTASEVTATLPQPYLLRANTRYTVWFHQANSPLGTSGCNMAVIDPTWFGYHTNVDPTMAPGPGEPGYFWAYQYGTNMRLLGFDNFDLGGSSTIGGTAQFQLVAPPLNIAFVLFALGGAVIPVPGLQGALHLDPVLALPGQLIGIVDPTGNLILTTGIPNNPGLIGMRVHVQALYDASFTTTGTFSPSDVLVVQ